VLSSKHIWHLQEHAYAVLLKILILTAILNKITTYYLR